MGLAVRVKEREALYRQTHLGVWLKEAAGLSSNTTLFLCSFVPSTPAGAQRFTEDRVWEVKAGQGWMGPTKTPFGLVQD